MYLSALKVSLEDTMKVHGTLQHVSFILVAGNSYLPSLSCAIKAFKDDRHRQHHVARDVCADLSWWKQALAAVLISHLLLPHTLLDPDVWVDASTSWGVGLVVKGHWVAWHLLAGWQAEDHDIGWAEMVAMELAMLWIQSAGIRDSKVSVHGDNMGVLGALEKGRSWNMACNLCIRRISTILMPSNVLLDPVYVTSEMNLTDACSRSKLGTEGTEEMHLLIAFVLLVALIPFIQNV